MKSFKEDLDYNCFMQKMVFYQSKIMKNNTCYLHLLYQTTKNLSRYIWRPPRLKELTSMVFKTGLTHLGSKASIYI